MKKEPVTPSSDTDPSSSGALDKRSPVPSSPEGRPTAFLMVCLGNICRSPLAEGILREKARAAGLSWEIDSAGTNGYHVGEAPHHLSQKVAWARDVDISRQRARKFNADDFQRFDKIYAMAGDVVREMRRIAGRNYDPAKVELLMNELHPGGNEDVPDPYYGSEPGYHEVYEMIDAAADRIIEKYGQASPSKSTQSNRS